MSEYSKFLVTKSQVDRDGGFEADCMPDSLFDFQRALVEWACRKGKAAIFADCGLGKTPMMLSWADNVVIATEGEVNVRANMERKEAMASEMFDSIIQFMNHAQQQKRTKKSKKVEVPTWLIK